MLNSARKSELSLSEPQSSLAEIDQLDCHLLSHFKSKFIVQTSLSRSLVSFQANKSRAVYRWYKYKEAFSASLVEYLLHKYEIVNGDILDPFAGSGTALFVARARGLNAEGIELLPIGEQIITVRKCLEQEFNDADLAALKRWSKTRPWEKTGSRCSLLELRITKDAYPEQTKDAIERYMSAWQQENERVQAVLRFALLCILESVSYTRKDGQYLRWDYRSGRQLGVKAFDKGLILDFAPAVCAKINEIISDFQSRDDMGLFPVAQAPGEISLHQGSCLNILPTLTNDAYDAVVTSPPYCNRYDYTRTYALELAVLGIGMEEMVRLRQEMLSCTVENRAKDLLEINPRWADALMVAEQQELLQTVLRHLEEQRARGVLNNNGIPRMVRGYFYEMACVIAECSRVLKSNARLIMVNDNVRYAGASISVDMILSHMAEQIGFQVENILVLPNGKGNSSQQMGEHGRVPLRKCVYIWRKM